MKEKKFKIAKWIMLALAVLSNTFIISYSCIDEKTTENWNKAFTNFFASLINNVTSKEVKTIPLESIETHFIPETSFKYNYLPGYEVYEVPLGSEKQIETFFSPEDASNKSLVYSINDPQAAILNPSGSKLSIVGMKTGDYTVTAKSSDGNFETKTNIKVVDPVAPASFSISLDSNIIACGSYQTIKFDIDGGNLGHDELINFRYYDISKLSFLSSNESVATVSSDGTIYPVSTGSCSITVSNKSVFKKLDITVIEGDVPTPYSDLSISGSHTCYGNDMILDQSSKNNHFQLTPMNGSTQLNPEDFVWSSSNDLLVKVDKHGVMRGFRKTVLEDEFATITATSKITHQTASFDVTVKNQLPATMNYYFVVDGKERWNANAFTFSVGDNVEIEFFLSPKTLDKNVTATSSNDEVVSVTNEGNKIILHVLTEGVSTIKVVSAINPNLFVSIECTVVASGAISKDNIDDFGKYIRKSIGHAAVFMVAQIFTLLASYMFMYDRKIWLVVSIATGFGLLVSAISELIQYFVPSRSGTIPDVFINFAGVVVGALLVLLGIFIVGKIKNHKNNKASNDSSIIN